MLMDVHRLVKALGSDNIILDFTIENLNQIDLFFEQHAESGKGKANRRLSDFLKTASVKHIKKLFGYEKETFCLLM